MLHEEQLIQQLFRRLNSYLFDFAVLGGYPRDMHYSRQPKDLDICVYNYHPNDIAEIKLTDMLHNWLTRNGIKVKVYAENASASGDDRVYTVWTLDIGVDIIFWNEKTKYEVLQNFDFNINQFELDISTGEVVRHLKVPELDNELVMLRDLFQYNTDPVERILHVIDIATDIGWDVCSVKNNLKSQMRKM